MCIQMIIAQCYVVVPILDFYISNKEITFSVVLVCLLLSNVTQKL